MLDPIVTRLQLAGEFVTSLDAADVAGFVAVLIGGALIASAAYEYTKRNKDWKERATSFHIRAYGLFAGAVTVVEYALQNVLPVLPHNPAIMLVSTALTGLLLYGKRLKGAYDFIARAYRLIQTDVAAKTVQTDEFLQ